MKDFEILFSDQENWKESALCKGLKTADFFPERINKHNESKIRTLIHMCIECEVKVDCLHYACINEHDGIWAGTTFKERINWIKSLEYNNPQDVTYEDCYNFLQVDSKPYEDNL